MWRRRSRQVRSCLCTPVLSIALPASQAPSSHYSGACDLGLGQSRQQAPCAQVERRALGSPEGAGASAQQVHFCRPCFLLRPLPHPAKQQIEQARRLLKQAAPKQAAPKQAGSQPSLQLAPEQPVSHPRAAGPAMQALVTRRAKAPASGSSDEGASPRAGDSDALLHKGGASSSPALAGGASGPAAGGAAGTAGQSRRLHWALYLLALLAGCGLLLRAVDRPDANHKSFVKVQGTQVRALGGSGCVASCPSWRLEDCAYGQCLPAFSYLSNAASLHMLPACCQNVAHSGLPLLDPAGACLPSPAAACVGPSAAIPWPRCSLPFLACCVHMACSCISAPCQALPPSLLRQYLPPFHLPSPRAVCGRLPPLLRCWIQSRECGASPHFQDGPQAGGG